MDKKDLVQIYNGILLDHKKNHEMLAFVTTQMDLEGIMLSAMSVKETQFAICSLICG